MGFFAWIGLILAGVVVFFALLLVAPLRLRFLWGERQKSLAFRYIGWSVDYDFADKCRRIRFLNWTLASTRWPKESEGDHQRVGQESAHEAQGRTSGARRTRLFLGQARHLWNYRAALRRAVLVIVRFLGRMIRAWHLERARVSVHAGFSNPAQTGMATGWFYSIWSALAPRFPRVLVSWNPCFEQRKLTVNADVILRVLPVQLVYHAATALASLPWRALWKLRRAMRTEEELCRIT